jgi:hypothetical protein
MLTLPCPGCGQFAAHRLDFTSELSLVDYYRCGSCQLVWTIDRNDPTIVRPLAPRQNTNRPKIGA